MKLLLKDYVIHCKEKDYDVLIDRTSKWGNPFVLNNSKNDVERDFVLEQHKIWLMEQFDLLNSLNELKGKVLGCWCKSKKFPDRACHGDLLFRLANDLDFRQCFMFDFHSEFGNNQENNMNKHDLISENSTEKFEDRASRMLQNLEKTVYNCTMCGLGRKNICNKGEKFEQHVFSNMKPSKIIIIGQGPGYQECCVGRPFVGQSGNFFNEQLAIGGINRDDLYITNAVKCFVMNNEAPSTDEKLACEPFLKIELQLLKPKLIITLGAVAFDVVCPNLKMGDCLGSIVKSDKFGFNIFPIYHPSPLNMADIGRKKKFVEDISVLCQLIKLILKKG